MNSMDGWYYNQNVPAIRELRLDFATTVPSLSPVPKQVTQHAFRQIGSSRQPAVECGQWAKM